MSQIFEKDRAILLDLPEPEPFNVRHYHSLKQALANGDVRPDDRYLVASVAGTTLLLPILPMVYHHVAQGAIGDKHWMAAFCCLCNAGTVFSAHLQDKVYTFAAQGYYDVMVLLADEQTQSYWNHLTGECLHGVMAGAMLQRLNPLVEMRADEALAAYPDACLVKMEMNPDEMKVAERWNAVYRLPEKPNYGEGLSRTGKTDDTRLPTHDMGLGIWTETTQRYYSIFHLYESQNAIIDQLDGRTLVIIFDELVGLPVAFYYETDHTEIHGDSVLLGDGVFYRGGRLYQQGEATRLERPNQNTIRWYAFSAIFPGCQIYVPGKGYR